MEVKDFIILFLGWSLGLFSPLINEWFKNRHEQKRVRVALFSELEDVAHRLVLHIFFIRIQRGYLEKKELIWINDQLKSYKPIVEDRAESSLLEQLSVFLHSTEEDLLNYNNHVQIKGTVGIQKHSSPLLNARPEFKWSFGFETDRRLLDIQYRLGQLNELVDRSFHYHDLTFRELSSEDVLNIKNNINKLFLTYIKCARQIVTQVNQLKL